MTRPSDLRVAAGTRPTLAASTLHVGDTAVLTLVGALGGAGPLAAGASVETVLDTLEGALRPRPRTVLANVAHVEPSRFVVGLLSLMRRRAARAGVTLVLVGLSAALGELLDAARVTALYATFPTVGLALAALEAGPVGRSTHPDPAVTGR